MAKFVPDKKLRVGVIGATGMVGQRFISLLENHPWFNVVTVAASPRSAGKRYEDAVGDRWKMPTPMPEAVKDLIVYDASEVEKVAATCDFVFSAVDLKKDEIRAIEEAYAKTETPVVSNNSAHRWTPDVPMVVPELNPEHYEIIPAQRKRLGTKRGFIASMKSTPVSRDTSATSRISCALSMAGFSHRTALPARIARVAHSRCKACGRARYMASTSASDSSSSWLP